MIRHITRPDTPEQVTHIIKEDDHAVMARMSVGMTIEDGQQVQQDEPGALRIWEFHPWEPETASTHQPQSPSRHICKFAPSPDAATRELERLPPPCPRSSLMVGMKGR